MSDETTLADLLQLNLHKFEDEVRSIVDKAVKESGMEKVQYVPPSPYLADGQCAALLLWGSAAGSRAILPKVFVTH